MDKLVIFGTGGFAREVYGIIEAIDEQKLFVQEKSCFVGFLDDNIEMHGQEFYGSKVLGGIEWLKNNKNAGVIVAIGNPSIKKRIVEEIKKIEGVSFPTIVHPRALIGNKVHIGEGCVVCANTIITTDVVIKNHVILNLSCTIGHDSIIEDFVTVAPGSLISGNVKICEGSDIGTGSNIIQGKKIGSWSIVGAGAVVIKDVPDNVTSVGNPAKVIKNREDGWHLVDLNECKEGINL